MNGYSELICLSVGNILLNSGSTQRQCPSAPPSRLMPDANKTAETREKNGFIGLPPCFTVLKRKAKMGTSLDQWKFISHAKWPSIVAAISLLTDHRATCSSCDSGNRSNSLKVALQQTVPPMIDYCSSDSSRSPLNNLSIESIISSSPTSTLVGLYVRLSTKNLLHRNMSVQ